MDINLLSSATTESTQKLDKSTADKAVGTQSNVGVPQAATEDKTTLTADSASVQTLTKAAIQTVPSREIRVESLRQAVNSAQYQLDAAKIAESLSSAQF